MSNDSEADADDPAVEDETDEADEEGTPAGLAEGDFVELDYTARTVDGGALVDTTDPDVAAEEDVGEDQEFGPRIIVLGEGHLFEAVESDIYGKEPGDSGTVTVPAGEAFGEYDESEVRTVSKEKIPEDDRYPGGHVDIDGEHGHVETIIGGRARVDFNHPLAGEDVEYEYEILREVEDRQERAEGLLDMFLDVDLNVWFETDTVEEERPVEPDEDDAEVDEAGAEDDGADAGAADAADEETDGEGADEPPEPEFETVEVDKETLYIEATPQLSMNQQWMMGKQQIAQQIVRILDVDRIIVQEELGGGMGMMGGMGGMMGGGPGGADLEEALEDADVDADELVEELETAEE